jgi:TDG/mug DNA glycosylase family protein
VASLEKGQYYGNPRNHFWPILAAALERTCPESYAERLGLLEAGSLALWDVIGSCERQGSLDEAILGESANDLLGFLAAHPSIRRVGLNGGKAALSFRATTCPELRAADFEIDRRLSWRPMALGGRTITLVRLPSTSPVPTRDFRSAEDRLPPWSAFIRETGGDHVTGMGGQSR